MAPRSSLRSFAKGQRVILFVDRRRSDAADAEARFAQARWPDGTRTEIIDVATDHERASWYGIADVPAVAVVCDGVLLAIEHECDAAACERVCEVARQRDPRTLDGLFLPRTP